MIQWVKHGRGVSQRAALIENIRKAKPKRTLLDAGDIFSGYALFHHTMGGELDQITEYDKIRFYLR
jgi:2',3'-cyclic-nucleotide 2'-phosphodiesterase (5'-nucleotidase family)